MYWNISQMGIIASILPNQNISCIFTTVQVLVAM